MTAAIVLAAGESSRMGVPKLALRLEGEALLLRAVRKAQAFADAVIVVLGAHAAAYRPLLAGLDCTVVVNPEWQEGMGSSVRCGVAALPEGVEEAVILLPDQPFVAPEHFQALLQTRRETLATLVLSRYSDGNRGVPALLRRALFAAARALPGSCGAKALIPHAELVADVLLDPGQEIDVDTPEAARRWLGAAP